MCSSALAAGDRKSTRLNSSLVEISYAVFCLKKKKRVGGWKLMSEQRWQGEEGRYAALAAAGGNITMQVGQQGVIMVDTGIASISDFFIDTATTNTYTLSLHDALPI